MSRRLLGPGEPNEDAGHPHECREGHRWQHTGPSAVTCEISSDDPDSGNLLVGPQDCPRCSGNEEVLTRDLHSHYCNMCEGDWDHEGRCLDGIVACCPWCFPQVESEPAPGARRGPHFHYCPECAQNWQHGVACSAPLRAVLADCPGCRKPRSERGVEPFTASAPARTRSLQAVRERIGPYTVPVSLVASVILATPILLGVSRILWSKAPQGGALVSDQRIDARLAVSAPAGEAPGTAAPSPREASSPTAPAQPSEAIGLGHPEQALPIVSLPQPADETRTGPTPWERFAEQRMTERRSVRVPRQAEPDEQPKRTAPPTALSAVATEDLRDAPAAPPPPPPRERIAEPQPQAPDVLPAPSEGGARATRSARITKPSVPGAPLLGSPSGGAALDILAGAQARFVSRSAREPKAEGASQSLQDLPTWASESPRWDRLSIAALMRAVVDVRFSKRTSTDHGAPRRTPAELHPRPNRGFIIDRQGYIVTHDRTVSGVSAIQVTLHDGRTLPAAVVARDRLNDIAILKVEQRGLPVIALGDSWILEVGERVLAIGNGGAVGRAPTVATVRATGAGSGGNLAVDLTPKPDGAGGPLLNRLGQVVGIVTDSATATGARPPLTFAVPVDRVKPIIRNLMSRPAAGSRDLPEGQ